jgi:hypothetical protein
MRSFYDKDTEAEIQALLFMLPAMRIQSPKSWPAEEGTLY